MPRPITKLLVANRSEIAIRIFRAGTELGLRTVAIYSHQDRFALHRFKADEAYPVGRGKEPVRAYLGIEEVIAIARECGADAIHPGYGFLAENPSMAEACLREGITWIGPPPSVMVTLGNKVAARELATRAGVPVMPATTALTDDPAEILAAAERIGYPVMVKASWGGGGRGMRMVQSADTLLEQVAAGRREAEAAFGNGEVFLEKLVQRARHIEVQILGDQRGRVVHLFERDCTMQRRHQKVIEWAPSPVLTAEQRAEVCESAVRLAKEARYVNAGTVEFLMDTDTGAFYFIEVNPRIQVEHTVTEVVTGIDIVKSQIQIAQGVRIGDPKCAIPNPDALGLNGFAMQARITTEDPTNGFVPDYGRITAYRDATGFGIRLDGGTAYAGAIVTPYYDSMLEKLTAWAPTAEEAMRRADRALREFRIRGVKTNLNFLEALVNHPRFRAGDYTTRFVDETPELFRFTPRQDRATRLLAFLGNVTVNGNPEVAGRPHPGRQPTPRAPVVSGRPPVGARDRLLELGPDRFARWMRNEERLLITDTTFRDAHQSLLATRVRTNDLTGIASAYAHLLPQLLSVECWGGATFDVAMRFLKECPWDRLAQLRERMPNLLLQMLLRASNAVGYANYPDNVVRYFVAQAADAGIDLFRVFDSLNWVDNMRVAIDAVRDTGMLCEAAICYTGDITDPARPKYDLRYYLELARQLEAAGANILGIKDMAGLCKPEAARQLVRALREEVGIPVHFHTHDTSGVSAASALAAAEAGADAVDAAMDPMSGLTSQPSLGGIVEALRGTSRHTKLDRKAIARVCSYWEAVRRNYLGFESDLRSGTSEVYVHEMPGGQYTNLREQARALGIEERWPEVAETYADVNRLFGDIVKVTPTSKVVGDLAVYMVTNGLTVAEIQDPEKDVAFPESVVELFRGDLGQPHGGFPEALQRKVLKGQAPMTERPGAVLPSVDLAAAREEVEATIARPVSDRELASYLMYPKVFVDYAAHRRTYGDVSVLPTPVFFYGLDAEDELAVDIERGKTLIIRFFTVGEPDEDGRRTVFFELNGQPREVSIFDVSLARSGAARPKATEGDATHVAAPMPGMVVSVLVSAGQAVARGDRLCSIEAMKMETSVFAERDGIVGQVLVGSGAQVDTHDLLMTITDPVAPDGEPDTPATTATEN
ncbi:MAG: pyruvate carboxylase [Actinobacteria bacterium]|nr:pyruvate carboxylase [Actinomycetota bacterium]